MTSTIAITGMNRVTRPKENRGGNTVLAYFDAELHGLELRGCAFVRTKGNGLVAWPPLLPDDEKRRSVRILDDSLRHALMMKARETYRVLGGTDAEWIGKSIPAPAT